VIPKLRVKLVLLDGLEVCPRVIQRVARSSEGEGALLIFCAGFTARGFRVGMSKTSDALGTVVSKEGCYLRQALRDAQLTRG